MSAGKGATLGLLRWWKGTPPAAEGGRAAGARRATAGPVTAEALQVRYVDAVFRYVARRMPGASEAEDVTAEVFAAAFDCLGRCPPLPAGPDGGEDEPARAWLFGIARRKVADHFRKQGRRPEESLESLPVAALAGARMGGAGPDSPEAAALRAERARVLRQLLAGLHPDQREVLLLKYAEGLSQEEAARAMGRSTAAVNSLLQRARAAVRDKGRAYFLDDGAIRSEEEGERHTR